MVDFRKFYKENANVAYTVLGYPNLQTSEAFCKDWIKALLIF